MACHARLVGTAGPPCWRRAAAQKKLRAEAVCSCCCSDAAARCPVCGGASRCLAGARWTTLLTGTSSSGSGASSVLLQRGRLPSGKELPVPLNQAPWRSVPCSDAAVHTPHVRPGGRGEGRPGTGLAAPAGWLVLFPSNRAVVRTDGQRGVQPWLCMSHFGGIQPLTSPPAPPPRPPPHTHTTPLHTTHPPATNVGPPPKVVQTPSEGLRGWWWCRLDDSVDNSAWDILDLTDAHTNPNGCTVPVRTVCSERDGDLPAWMVKGRASTTAVLLTHAVACWSDAAGNLVCTARGHRPVCGGGTVPGGP